MASPKVTPRDLKRIKTRVEGKIKRAREFDPNQNFLIYGPPKVGKTRLCATAPEPLIIDVDEEGTDSVRDSNPRVIRIKSWGEINDVYWYLQSGDHTYESVCVDGITGLQTLCMNFVLGDEASRDASRDPDAPSQRIYQKVSQLMKTQITNFRNLPMNTVFTALPRVRETGEGDEEVVMLTGPNVSPAIAAHVNAAVGIIGYVVKRKVTVKKRVEGKIQRERVTRTRLIVDGNDRYVLGERTGKFGEYIDSPNLTNMLEVIFGEKG